VFLDVVRATTDDATAAANLAVAKRAEYERFSPVFWRVAANARELHEPFLAFCIADPGFTSLAVRHADGPLAGIAIASHRVGPPPFNDDSEPSWLVDDFFVRSADEWPTVGAALLRGIEAAAVESGATRVVVLSARRDAPKRDAIAALGYTLGASWWVHPVSPRPGKPGDLPTTKPVVGPAPPVYDPGGLTALALEMRDPADVPLFDDWAAASNAVLAIVPALETDPALQASLQKNGYEPASDWFVKSVAIS
jgi:hypothetical protein